MTAKKIVLIVLVAIVAVLAIGFGIFYLNVSQIRFDYCDSNVYVDAPDLDKLLDSGYIMSYPFFGNSATISSGDVYGFPFGIGEQNIPVYDAVNVHIRGWAYATVTEYDNRVKIDYNVESDGKTLTVVLNGTGEKADGVEEKIEKTFVFDIENASLDNLPKLLS